MTAARIAIGLCLVALAGAGLLFSLRFAPQTADADPLPVCNESGTLATNTTWVSTCVHLVTSSVTVSSSATLTVEPGAIVKLSGNLNVQGSLVALGTSGQPIYFTSSRDDTVGGDSNGDGTSTAPAAGNWGGILVFNSGAAGAQAAFDYATIRYGGAGGFSGVLTNSCCSTVDHEANISVNHSSVNDNQYGGIYVGGGAALTVANSTVSNNNNAGVYVGDGAAPRTGPTTIDGSTFTNNGGDGIYGLHGSGGPAPIITNNVLTDNAYPIRLSINSGGVTFDNNTGSGNAFDAINLSGGTVTTDMSLPHQPDFPYELGSLTIGTTATLTIAPGTGLKMQGTLSIQGSLLAEGTAGEPITFTSSRDDTVGGDTNGDGTATVPTPGNWNGILVMNSTTAGATASLDHVSIRYGGAGSFSGALTNACCLIHDGEASITVNHATISNNQYGGIYVGGGAALTVLNSTISNNNSGGLYTGDGSAYRTGPTTVDSTTFANNGGDGIYGQYQSGGPGAIITNSVFNNNGGYAVRLGINSGGVTFDNNTGSGNAFDAINLSGGTVTTDLSLPHQPDFPYDVSNLTIGTSATLTIEPGAIMKMRGTLAIQGSLVSDGSSGAPITFTSWKDDTVGGDTNGDGNATFALPGDWRSITVARPLPGGASAIFDHTVVAFGGDWGCSFQLAVITNSCLQADPLATITMSNSRVVYSESAGFQVTGGASLNITNSTIADNATYGVWGGTSSNYVVARNNYWGHPSGPNSDGVACSPESLEMDPPGIGDTVSCYVYFSPWIGYAPPLSPAAVNGSPASNPFGAFSLEPINLATGNYTYQATDVAIGGKGPPLVFARSYNSIAIADGPLGHGWQSNLHVRLEFDNPDHALANVTVVGEEGRQDAYTRQSDGSYSATPGTFAVLTRNTLDGSFLLRRKDRSLLSFDSDGVLQTVEDRNGNDLTFSYSSGRLASVMDASGRTLALGYDANDRITSLTDPLGRVTTFAYDAAGDLVSVTDAELQTTTYSYDASHQMLSLTDPRGNVAMTNVFTAGKVTQQTNADGKTWLYAYGAGTTVETDPLSRSTTYVFDPAHRVISTTDADGGTTTIEYDGYGSRRLVTDPLGHTTTMTHDARGNLLALADASGAATAFAYSAEDDLLTSIAADGGISSLTYDANGNVLTATDAAGGVTTSTYDAEGQVITVENARGFTTTFTYDAHGYPATITDALGGISSASYDVGGRVLSQTDALGHSTSHTYDDVDRLLSTTDALGNASTNPYDANGNTTSVTDKRGKTTTYTYDVLNQLVTETSPTGGVTTNAYDDVGNQVSVQDPNLDTTTSTFDDLNRRLTLTDPLGHVTTTSYDAVGNILSMADANSNITTFSYDEVNRPTTVTDAEGGTITYAYDEMGNRVSMTDANGHLTTYTYDLLRRLTSMTDAEGNSTTYAYDAVGNRTQRVDANGKITNYTYDALNRLTKIAYPAVTSGTDQPQVTYAYDAVGNRVSMTDLLGTTDYEYDDLDRLSLVTFPGDKEVGYGYDEAGNRTSLTYPDGKVVAYAYDDANRLDVVTDWAARTASYEYDAASRLVSVARSNGASSTFAYDDASRLTSIAQPGGTISYTLDNVGNRLTRGFGSDTEAYGYDNLYRLTSVQYAEGDCQDYGYDAVGNRTSLTVRDQVSVPCDGTPAVTNYVHDTADRLTLAGGDSYSFNANGDQVRAGQRGFQYDREDRLTRVADWELPQAPLAGCPSTNGDGAINAGDQLALALAFASRPGQPKWTPLVDPRHDGVVNAGDQLTLALSFFKRCKVMTASAYDGDGLRQYRTEPTTGQGSHTTRYYWDVAGPIPLILQDSDGRSFVYGHDLLLEDNAGAAIWPLQDGLGSTVATLDPIGGVVSTLKYDAFGALRSGSQQTFGFAGEQADLSASVYLRARSYEPGTGRFLSEDPLVDAGELPRYTYADNAPTNNVDPTGLYAQRPHRARPHLAPASSWICICYRGTSSIGGGFSSSSSSGLNRLSSGWDGYSFNIGTDYWNAGGASGSAGNSSTDYWNSQGSSASSRLATTNTPSLWNQVLDVMVNAIVDTAFTKWGGGGTCGGGAYSGASRDCSPAGPPPGASPLQRAFAQHDADIAATGTSFLNVFNADVRRAHLMFFSNWDANCGPTLSRC